MSKIHTELANQFPGEFQRPNHGSLVSWAKSGVLLLNIIQTARRNLSKEHAGLGWERFADVILELVDRMGGHKLVEPDATSPPSKGLVFLVWGDMASNRIEQSPIPSVSCLFAVLQVAEHDRIRTDSSCLTCVICPVSHSTYSSRLVE